MYVNIITLISCVDYTYTVSTSICILHIDMIINQIFYRTVFTHSRVVPHAPLSTGACQAKYIYPKEHM